MQSQQLSRRDVLLQGGAAWAGLAGLASPVFAQMLPTRPGEETVEWIDQPPANPSGGVVVNLQPWETLTRSRGTGQAAPHPDIVGPEVAASSGG
jgi:hypothetical protein